MLCSTQSALSLAVAGRVLVLQHLASALRRCSLKNSEEWKESGLSHFHTNHCFLCTSNRTALRFMCRAELHKQEPDGILSISDIKCDTTRENTF